MVRYGTVQADMVMELRVLYLDWQAEQEVNGDIVCGLSIWYLKVHPQSDTQQDHTNSNKATASSSATPYEFMGERLYLSYHTIIAWLLQYIHSS